MYKIFKENITEAERIIRASSDHELASHDYAMQVAKRCEIGVPEIERSKMKTDIGKEIPNKDIASPQFSYVPGDYYEFASYTIPVLFSTEIPEEVLKKYSGVYDFGRARFDRSNWIYIQFSKERIIGDDDLIKEIKANAAKALEDAEGIIADFSREAQEFNNVTLPNTIEKVIVDELKKRNDRNDSLDNLKF